ncbi:MAG: C-GCAxxG-C-C family protein [Muribaculaceae bacterium]|nr:C-GCAxxG-C-C family protein [Muribaculaceae bacterium]
MNHEEAARKTFLNGYNCAQSVFLAYSKELGFDDATALKLSSSFGGGMGRLREVCGAVSAMFMIAGLKQGYTENNNDDVKGEHYALIQKLAKEFEQENGSILCRELLGLDGADNPVPSKRTKEYYDERPCEDVIGSACRIIDRILY